MAKMTGMHMMNGKMMKDSDMKKPVKKKVVTPPAKKKVVQMPSKISPSMMTPAQKARYLANPERYDK